MGLTTIRAEAKRTLDRISSFTNAEIDAAANEWQLDAWLELDKVAPHLTRKEEAVALSADDLTFTLTATDFLRALFIEPPSTLVDTRKFTFAREDLDFYRNRNGTQTEILVAQRGALTFYMQPAVDSAFTIQVHFVYRPPTITTSQDPTVFTDEVIWPGVIWKLLEDINFADAPRWELRARRRLQAFLRMYGSFGDNSDLSGTIPGFPY